MLLVQSYSGQSPLHVAAQKGQLPFVVEVLARAVDVDKNMKAVGGNWFVLHY